MPRWCWWGGPPGPRPTAQSDSSLRAQDGAGLRKAVRGDPTRARGPALAIAILLAVCLAIGAAPAGNPHFVLLGDRTGEVQAGVYERVWKEVASAAPEFVVSVGDTIQGGNDATAEAEW